VESANALSTARGRLARPSPRQALSRVLLLGTAFSLFAAGCGRAVLSYATDAGATETMARATSESGLPSMYPDADAADGIDAGLIYSDVASDDGGPRCTASLTQLAQGPQAQQLDGATFAGGVQPGMDLVVSETDLFYSFNVGPTPYMTYVMRLPLGGGLSPRVFAMLDGGEVAMRVTAGGLVLALTDNLAHTGGRILSLAFDGGSPATLAMTSGGPLATLAVDENNAYFSDTAGTKSVPLRGGTAQTLTAQNGSIALVGSSLVIADGDNVYRIGASGGGLSTVASGQSAATAPVPCGMDTCWFTLKAVAPPSQVLIAGQGLGTIVDLSQGGSPRTVVSSWSLAGTTLLIFDGFDFYVSASQNLQGSLDRVPGMGGLPIRLETGFGPLGIAVDDQCLYWGSVDRGIFSVAKAAAQQVRTQDSGVVGSGMCLSPDSGTAYCDNWLSCTTMDGAPPRCTLGVDASPCGAFSCGPGCACADAQSNACACVTP
jgi:hypothetical protein